MIADIVGNTTWAYAPMFYEPEYHADGTLAAMHRTRADVPREVLACTINAGLRRHPAADAGRSCSFVQTPHDRIAIEIMRGCPVAVPLLPIDRHQTAVARALGRDHRAGGPGELPQHRPRTRSAC